MIRLGERWEQAMKRSIERYGLSWHVTRLGCRAEYAFRPTPPRTGAEAAAAEDPELSRYLHLHVLNRGVLLTPFHEMALMSPVTSEEDVAQHAAVFEEALADLAG